MEVAILAGGQGTHLSEQTTPKPMPMVETRGKPILWYIMSIFAAHGRKEFVVALGYKGEEWVAHLLDTSADTQTGGRGKRLANHIGRDLSCGTI